MVNTDKLFLPENYIPRHYEYMVELTQNTYHDFINYIIKQSIKYPTIKLHSSKSYKILDVWSVH